MLATEAAREAGREGGRDGEGGRGYYWPSACDAHAYDGYENTHKHTNGTRTRTPRRRVSGVCAALRARGRLRKQALGLRVVCTLAEQPQPPPHEPQRQQGGAVLARVHDAVVRVDERAVNHLRPRGRRRAGAPAHVAGRTANAAHPPHHVHGRLHLRHLHLSKVTSRPSSRLRKRPTNPSYR